MYDVTVPRLLVLAYGWAHRIDFTKTSLDCGTPVSICKHGSGTIKNRL